MANLTVTTWDDLPEIEMSAQVSRRQISGDKMTSIKLNMARGATLPVHQHPHEQITQPISGKIKYKVGGETHYLEAGAVLFVPGDVPHGLETLEDTVIVEVFSPPREDLLA